MSNVCNEAKPTESLSELVTFASKKYEDVFNGKPTVYGYAPGRVNLIGDHVDYNDGLVLPMAIPLFTVVIGSRSDTNKCKVVTLCDHVTEHREVELDINDLTVGQPTWSNYVKGVMFNFPEPLVPFNCVIASSLPVGAGLSSSASLEVAFFSFLEGLLDEGLKLSLKEKALICQKAEHTYAQVPCGIMDQLVVCAAKEKHVLLIDCRTLDTENVPLMDTSVRILVINSNVRHDLSESEYASRRKACEQVASMLARSTLRDVGIRELETSRSVLTNDQYAAAAHVVTEISRTSSAVAALKKQDHVIFGTLMTQSHGSLRDDFRVSCPELDELVEITLECEGVHGSRMTGGGFGGCTVSLVQADQVEHVVQHIRKNYSGKADFFVFSPCDGAGYRKL